MRISTFLPATLVALTLSMTVGCTTDESDPTPAKNEQAVTQSPEAAQADGDTGSPAAADSTGTPDAPAANSADVGTGSLKISSSYSMRTTDCTGRDVSIEGQANTIELTGTCGTVAIGGKFNTVAVEAADTIKITGNSSTVNAETVGAIRLDGAYFVTVNWVNGAGGKEPSVSGDGKGYTVNRVSRQAYDNQVRP